MDNNALGQLQASVAIARDITAIWVYLADKKSKGIPISKEERETIREHCEYMKIFVANNKKHG